MQSDMHLDGTKQGNELRSQGYYEKQLAEAAPRALEVLEKYFGSPTDIIQILGLEKHVKS